MLVRKNLRSLAAAERGSLVAALLELKRTGRYDQYVHWHHHVMVPSVLPHEPRDANYRNGAHRGPSFLPWHRQFLLLVDEDLRAAGSTVSLPYWDWTEDAATPDPATAPIWADDLMGGNGCKEDEWRVQSGPFAYAAGKWPVPPYPDDGLPGPGLKRAFGTIVNTLPTENDVALAMQEFLYDTPSYDRSPFTIGFRNRLEGWVTRRGDHRVQTEGSQLHNRVHLWVGGNMVPMTSPDDPVFFLHHCFVDKLWADWQALQNERNPAGVPHYAPLRTGPPGHNLGDTLQPWGTKKISDLLDIASLGYSYEAPVPRPHGLSDTPQLAARRSPFWAD